jgi:hypothetical protein
VVEEHLVTVGVGEPVKDTEELPESLGDTLTERVTLTVTLPDWDRLVLRDPLAVLLTVAVGVTLLHFVTVPEGVKEEVRVGERLCVRDTLFVTLKDRLGLLDTLRDPEVLLVPQLEALPVEDLQRVEVGDLVRVTEVVLDRVVQAVEEKVREGLPEDV